jgi:orotate phosphoribosyltransferase
MEDKKDLILAMHHYGLCRYQPENPFIISPDIQSSWYFDIKSALLLDITRNIICRMLNHQINKILDFKPPIPLIGGPANGAYLLTALIYGFPKFFIYHKSIAGLEISENIEGWKVREGDRVILIDDIMIAESLMLSCIKYVEKNGGKLTAIIPVLDCGCDGFEEYNELIKPLIVENDFALWEEHKYASE